MSLELALSHPGNFRQAILVDTDQGPKRLSEVLDPWQAADFEALDNGWLQAAGLPTGGGPVYRRAWLERPRGHSKTGDIAVAVTWILLSGKRVSGIACAADRDQAKLLRDAIDKLASLNPWIGELLDIQTYKVINKQTKATLEILSADARSSYGQTPDFIVCDEVTHWPSGDLWDASYSSAAKKNHCLLVVITNAGTGLGSSWQWRIREAVEQHEAWYFHRLDGPKASWISEEILAEQRALLPLPSFRRLWLNEWLSEAGDAIPEDYIITALDGDCHPHKHALPGYSYALGCDLGWSKDSSAVAVVGKHLATHRFHLADLKVWTPKPNVKVRLSDVEEHIVATYQRFRIAKGLMDRMQAEKILQDIATDHPRIKLEGFSFSPSTWHKLTTTTLQCFEDGLVSLYSHPILSAELRRTSIIENSQGNLKLYHPRIDGSHGDAATAFYLALYAAQGLMQQVSFGRPRGFAAGGGIRGLSQPDLLRRIGAALAKPHHPGTNAFSTIPSMREDRDK